MLARRAKLDEFDDDEYRCAAAYMHDQHLQASADYKKVRFPRYDCDEDGLYGVWGLWVGE
jgi:hypothetical protein